MREAVDNSHVGLLRLLGMNFCMVVLSDHAVSFNLNEQGIPSPIFEFFYESFLCNLCSQYGIFTYPPMEAFDIITNKEIRDRALHEAGLKLPYHHVRLPNYGEERSDLTLSEVASDVANDTGTCFVHKNDWTQRNFGSWEFVKKHGMIAKPLSGLSERSYGVLIFTWSDSQDRWNITDIRGNPVKHDTNCHEFIIGSFGFRPITYGFEPYLVVARQNEVRMISHQHNNGQATSLFDVDTWIDWSGVVRNGEPWNKQKKHLKGIPGDAVKALKLYHPKWSLFRHCVFRFDVFDLGETFKLESGDEISDQVFLNEVDVFPLGDVFFTDGLSMETPIKDVTKTMVQYFNLNMTAK